MPLMYNTPFVQEAPQAKPAAGVARGLWMRLFKEWKKETKQGAWFYRALMASNRDIQTPISSSGVHAEREFMKITHRETKSSRACLVNL